MVIIRVIVIFVFHKYIIMKLNNFLFLFIILIFIGCGSEGSDTTSVTNETAPPVTLDPNGAVPPPTAAPTAEPAQNADGVWHFTCAKGCAGGAGKIGPCPKCGEQLAHNQAYHSGAAAQPGATATINAGDQTTTQTIQPQITTTPGGTPPAGAGAAGATLTPPPAEPAQNAAGVWHFTCPKGCAGGGAKVGPCPKCGENLAHNQAYHQ